MRRIVSAGFVLILLMAAVWSVRPTAGATLPLKPASYATTSGAAGGQPVSALATRDQSGAQNDWNKYVEFGPANGAAYAGYRTYVAPAGTTPDSLTASRLM